MKDLKTKILTTALLVGANVFQAFSGSYNDSLENRKGKLALVFESTSLTGGYSVIPRELPRGTDYNVILLLGHLSFDMRDYINPAKKGRLQFHFEPSFNPVKIGSSFTEVDYGLNFGFKYLYKLKKDYSVFALVGTGPHNFTTKTRAQAKGFLFSDNFGLGAVKKISRNYGINLQVRWRHMSNLTFKSPNKGINNLFILGGLTRFI